MRVRVFAEAVCESLHKASPRKRGIFIAAGLVNFVLAQRDT